MRTITTLLLMAAIVSTPENAPGHRYYEAGDSAFRAGQI